MEVIESNADSAAQGDVVDPHEHVEQEQHTEQEPTGAESEVADPTTGQEEKPVQSKEENSKYAEVRRRAEQDAIDRTYKELYGEYGINSKADYDAYVRAEREKELMERLQVGEVDVETVRKELLSSHPDIIAANEIRKQHYMTTELSGLNKELKALGLGEVGSLDEIDDLPNSGTMAELVGKGYSLADAYVVANRETLVNQAKQETIKKLQANRSASPGSLSDGGNTDVLYTKEQVEAMSVSEISKNYDLVIKSSKSWK